MFIFLNEYFRYRYEKVTEDDFFAYCQYRCQLPADLSLMTRLMKIDLFDGSSQTRAARPLSCKNPDSLERLHCCFNPYKPRRILFILVHFGQIQSAKPGGKASYKCPIGLKFRPASALHESDPQRYRQRTINGYVTVHESDPSVNGNGP